jgi:hypothetical protein
VNAGTGNHEDESEIIPEDNPRPSFTIRLVRSKSIKLTDATFAALESELILTHAYWFKLCT